MHVARGLDGGQAHLAAPRAHHARGPAGGAVVHHHQVQRIVAQAAAARRAQHRHARFVQAAQAAVRGGERGHRQAETQGRTLRLHGGGRRQQCADLLRALPGLDVEVDAGQVRRVVAGDETFHAIGTGAGEDCALPAGGNQVADAGPVERRHVGRGHVLAALRAPHLVAAFAAGKGPGQRLPSERAGGAADVGRAHTVRRGRDDVGGRVVPHGQMLVGAVDKGRRGLRPRCAHRQCHRGGDQGRRPSCAGCHIGSLPEKSPQPASCACADAGWLLLQLNVSARQVTVRIST